MADIDLDFALGNILGMPSYGAWQGGPLEAAMDEDGGDYGDGDGGDFYGYGNGPSGWGNYYGAGEFVPEEPGPVGGVEPPSPGGWGSPWGGYGLEPVDGGGPVDYGPVEPGPVEPGPGAGTGYPPYGSGYANPGGNSGYGTGYYNPYGNTGYYPYGQGNTNPYGPQGPEPGPGNPNQGPFPPGSEYVPTGYNPNNYNYGPPVPPPSSPGGNSPSYGGGGPGGGGGGYGSPYGGGGGQPPVSVINYGSPYGPQQQQGDPYAEQMRAWAALGSVDADYFRTLVQGAMQGRGQDISLLQTTIDASVRQEGQYLQHIIGVGGLLNEQERNYLNYIIADRTANNQEAQTWLTHQIDSDRNQIAYMQTMQNFQTNLMEAQSRNDANAINYYQAQIQDFSAQTGRYSAESQYALGLMDAATRNDANAIQYILGMQNAANQGDQNAIQMMNVMGSLANDQQRMALENALGNRNAATNEFQAYTTYQLGMLTAANNGDQNAIQYINTMLDYAIQGDQNAIQAMQVMGALGNEQQQMGLNYAIQSRTVGNAELQTQLTNAIQQGTLGIQAYTAQMNAALGLGGLDLQRQQLAWQQQQGMMDTQYKMAGLLAGLRGPRDEFARQAVLHGINPETGVSRGQEAIFGGNPMPSFQGDQAAPEPVTMGSFLQDNGMGNLLPAAGGFGVTPPWQQPGQMGSGLPQQPGTGAGALPPTGGAPPATPPPPAQHTIYRPGQEPEVVQGPPPAAPAASGITPTEAASYEQMRAAFTPEDQAVYDQWMKAPLRPGQTPERQDATFTRQIYQNIIQPRTAQAQSPKPVTPVQNPLPAAIAPPAHMITSDQNLDQYAYGTYDVTHTGPAVVDAGEMVLPKRVAEKARRGQNIANEARKLPGGPSDGKPKRRTRTGRK